MKNWMKKVVVVALAVVMVLSMAACGKEKTSDAAKVYKIGGIGPITGAVAIYGEAVKNGAELAFAEINAAGGINGCQVEFYWEDDQHDTTTAVSAYNALKDKDIQLLIGAVTSGPCAAVATETEADNMFQLTPSGSSTAAVPGANAFRVCFSDPNQGIGSADYFAANFPNAKVGVLYDSSDVYSKGIYETFAAEANKKGVNVAVVAPYTNTSNTDFSVQLQQMNDAGVDLVFIPIYYQDAALILTQSKQAGYNFTFFGCDGLDGVIDQLGDNAAVAEGVMLLTPFIASAQDATTKKFVDAFKAKYNETPNQFAADGYDAAYIVKAAIEKAGVEAGADFSETCEALKVAMTQIKVDCVTGAGMTWTADGEPAKTPIACKIVNGEYAEV